MLHEERFLLEIFGQKVRIGNELGTDLVYHQVEGALEELFSGVGRCPAGVFLVLATNEPLVAQEGELWTHEDRRWEIREGDQLEQGRNGDAGGVLFARLFLLVTVGEVKGEPDQAQNQYAVGHGPLDVVRFRSGKVIAYGEARNVGQFGTDKNVTTKPTNEQITHVVAEAQRDEQAAGGEDHVEQIRYGHGQGAVVQVGAIVEHDDGDSGGGNQQVLDQGRCFERPVEGSQRVG